MPLKSLAEIRGDSGDNVTSDTPTSGLQSLQQIRFQNQQQSLMQDYPQMGADDAERENANNIYQNGALSQAYGNQLPFESTPVQPKPSFLDQLGQAVSPSAALQGLKNFGSKMVSDLESVPQTLNYPFAKAAQYAVPNAPLIGMREDGTYGNLPGTNAQQSFAAANPVPSTGNPVLDKVGDVIGQLAGPMVGSYGTGLGELPGIINNGLARAGVNFGAGLGGNIAKGAVEGALVGAPYNTAATLATSDPSVSDVAKSAGQGALLGGGLGAAAPILSRLGEIGQKYAGTKIGDALIAFDDRHNAVTPEQEQGVQKLMQQTPQSTGNYSDLGGTLRPATQEQYINKVINDIRPEVTQRMTPPLENPNELAKFVQQHWGEPISLNEVRKVPYADLSEMAQEMAKSMKMYDVAKQVASEKGYNLENILDNKLPNLQDRTTLDASKRAYGIYDAPKVQLARTKPTITGERLQSLSEVKSSAQEPRLQSPSEIKATKQEEALNAEVQPNPRIRDKVVKFADEQIDAARDRIKSRGNRLNSLPLDDWTDYAIIGAGHILKSGVKFADFSEAMVKDFGEQIRPHLADIYQRSIQLAKKQAKLTEKDIDRSRNMAKFAKNNEDTTLPNTRQQIVSKTKAERTPVVDLARQAYIKKVDDVHRLSNFDKYASDVLGRDLKATEKTHTLALNSRSSDVVSNHILTHDLVDAQGNHIGESFKDITKQIPKGKQGEFDDYLINMHAVTRMQRGEKVFPDEWRMSPEKSAKIVANYEANYPQFKQIAQQYYDFNRKLGQAWLVDTGLIPQEVFDAWGKENPFYVPMQRKFSELEKSKTFNAKSGGYGNQSKTVKEYSHVGSQRQIVSPIESTIEQIDRYVKTAKRNEVMQALIKNIAKNPDDFEGWAKIVSKEKMDMKKVLDDEGIDGILNQVDEPLQQAQIKNDLTKSNIVNGLINGEKVHVQVNDAQLLDALSNLHPSAQNFVIAALGRVTRMMKTLTTGFNPLFSLTRNIFRDIPEAYKNSTTTNNSAKFAFDLVHAIGSELGHGKLSEDYRAMGGGHSGNISASRNLLSQSKNKILQANTPAQKVMKGVRGAFHALENINSAFEQGPRLAEYKRTVKQGGGTYNAKVQGLYNANDVTVNFNRRGQISKDIDAIFPYYNAAIQGLDKFARSFNPKNPQQLLAVTLKSVAAVTIPQMVLYEINKDDPNYQKLSNYTKDNYFCIPKGDGTFFKIPKPREIGFIFGTLVERSLRKYEQNDPQAFKDIGATIKNVFAPPGISGMIDTQNGTISPTGALGDSIVGPGVNLLQNKDFAGRAIVPKDLQQLSPRLQYDTKTSSIAKSLGNILNKSPKEIDYLIKSYGGVIGQLGIPAATTGNGGNPLSRLGNSIKQNVTADPTYSNDISSNFYNAKSQYDTAKADAKSQGKVSNTIGIDMMLNRMSTTVSQIRKQMNTIQNNQNMPDDAKQQRLKAMQLQMNNIQQQALNALQKYQKAK